MKLGNVSMHIALIRNCNSKMTFACQNNKNIEKSNDNRETKVQRKKKSINHKCLYL